MSTITDNLPAYYPKGIRATNSSMTTATGIPDIPQNTISLYRKALFTAGNCFPYLRTSYAKAGCSIFSHRNSISTKLTPSAFFSGMGRDFFSEAYMVNGCYTSRDFSILKERTGLNGNVVKTILKFYKDKEVDILSMISQSFMPDCMKSAASETVKGRIKNISL